MLDEMAQYTSFNAEEAIRCMRELPRKIKEGNIAADLAVFVQSAHDRNMWDKTDNTIPAKRLTRAIDCCRTAVMPAVLGKPEVRRREKVLDLLIAAEPIAEFRNREFDAALFGLRRHWSIIERKALDLGPYHLMVKFTDTGKGHLGYRACFSPIASLHPFPISFETNRNRFLPHGEQQRRQTLVEHVRTLGQKQYGILSPVYETEADTMICWLGAYWGGWSVPAQHSTRLLEKHSGVLSWTEQDFFGHSRYVLQQRPVTYLPVPEYSFLDTPPEQRRAVHVVQEINLWYHTDVRYGLAVDHITTQQTIDGPLCVREFVNRIMESILRKDTSPPVEVCTTP